jgi:hypothetical protein
MSSTTPASPDTRVAELRREIATQEAACGCELGSIFTFSALALFMAHLAVNDTSWSTAGALGRGVLWVVGCSLVGKLLGLGWARLRVIQLREELHRTLTPHWPVPDLDKE